MEGKNLQKVPKAHLNIQSELFLYSKYTVLSIRGKEYNFSVIGKKVTFTIWLKLKDAVRFPVVCHLLGRKFTQGGSNLFLIFTLISCIKKTVQSSVYVGQFGSTYLPSTQQTVNIQHPMDHTVSVKGM